MIIVFNNRSYYNDEEHQERIAVRRERPVENKGIGVHINDPAPDLAALARALRVEGFGPITEPDQLGPTLERAIEIVQGGKPVVVDVVTQPRELRAPGTPSHPIGTSIRWQGRLRASSAPRLPSPQPSPEGKGEWVP